MVATPATIAMLRILRPPQQAGSTTLTIEVAGVFVFAAFWLVKGLEIRLIIANFNDRALAAASVADNRQLS